MKSANLIILLISLLSLAACEQTGSDIPDNPTDRDTNKWIEKIMRDNYLWYQEMPEQGSLDFSADPESFFASLLSQKDGKIISDEHHYFSTLEKATTTKSISNKNDSYGFDFAIGDYEDEKSTYKIALIVYVLKNSPAEEAGLKRGDWIIGVNGGKGTITDYNLLRRGGSTTFQLAKEENNTIIPTRKATIAASRLVEDTPFLKDTVLNYGSKRIGYLMYNHFTSGPNGYEDTAYDAYLRQLFVNFKARGVNEFVLDLRYNGGGQTSSAQLLASLLAPKNILGSTFCSLVYNDKHQQENHSIPFLYTQEVLVGNLDLKRLFVLAGQSTASSSELVINSLIPYLGTANIRLIGRQTFGKTVGMNVYDQSDTYGWILSPVCFKVYNANNEANYADGFTPNVPISEYNWPLVAFGEPNEALLSQAIQEITGQREAFRSSAKPLPFNIVYTPEPDIRNNLLLIQEN